jgi:cobalt transporter subunit CbtB
MRNEETTLSIVSLSTQERAATGVVALLLGLFLLYGVAFAHAHVLHNAAHDTRHAITVPCH